MWMEEFANGKHKFFLNAIRSSWKRVSVTRPGSARAKKEAQKLLDEKIDKVIRNFRHQVDCLLIC